MIKVAVVGATGYGGAELVRLLSAHPQVELTTLTSQTYAGQRIGDVYPNLASLDYALEALDLGAVSRADAVFFGLPHGEAMKDVPAVLEGGARVIDLSGDFRLKDAGAYPRWYGFEHTAPHLLAEAVYGLPETHRAEIAKARLVANPGCYPAGAVLAVLPLLRKGLVEASEIIVDSKSGISGAGRTSLKLAYHYPEADEDVAAYKVASHQHTPEMEQEMSGAAGAAVRVLFTPHLVPATRGIFTTAYVALRAGVTRGQVEAAYEETYRDEPFVVVCRGDALPHTKAARGSNFAHVAVRVEDRSGRAICLSALDNLGKGMASGAVQCLNIMFGLAAATAIGAPGAYP